MHKLKNCPACGRPRTKKGLQRKGKRMKSVADDIEDMKIEITELLDVLYMNLKSNEWLRSNEPISDGAIEGVDRVIRRTKKELKKHKYEAHRSGT